MGKVLTLNIKLVVSVDCMQMAMEWEKSQLNSIEIYIYILCMVWRKKRIRSQKPQTDWVTSDCYCRWLIYLVTHGSHLKSRLHAHGFRTFSYDFIVHSRIFHWSSTFKLVKSDWKCEDGKLIKKTLLQKVSLMDQKFLENEIHFKCKLIHSFAF